MLASATENLGLAATARFDWVCTTATQEITTRETTANGSATGRRVTDMGPHDKGTPLAACPYTRKNKVQKVQEVRRVQKVPGPRGPSPPHPDSQWTLWTLDLSDLSDLLDLLDLSNLLDLSWVLGDDGVGLVGASEPGGQAAAHAGDVLA